MLNGVMVIEASKSEQTGSSDQTEQYTISLSQDHIPKNVLFFYGPYIVLLTATRIFWFEHMYGHIFP